MTIANTEDAGILVAAELEQAAEIKRLERTLKQLVRDNKDLLDNRRNRFAEHALSALISKAYGDGLTFSVYPARIAEEAYKLADAMLAERAKGGGE